MVNSEGGLVLGRVGGILLLRRFVCIFGPRQLLVLGRLAGSRGTNGCRNVEAGSEVRAEKTKARRRSVSTYHSLSETLHCRRYSNSHMYSVGDLDASAARCRTLAGGDVVGQRGDGSGDPDCLCRPVNDHMSDSNPNVVQHSNRLR